MPGYLDTIRHWYEVYKVPDGDDRNRFGFEGKYQNKVCYITQSLFNKFL